MYICIYIYDPLLILHHIFLPCLRPLRALATGPRPWKAVLAETEATLDTWGQPWRRHGGWNGEVHWEFSWFYVIWCDVSLFYVILCAWWVSMVIFNIQTVIVYITMLAYQRLFLLDLMAWDSMPWGMVMRGIWGIDSQSSKSVRFSVGHIP